MNRSENLLPQNILERATLRGRECAWRVSDIPDVIDAAQDANLVNLGGQLQFRIPDNGTCECYWVEVDTHKEELGDRPWAERVVHTATAAREQFQQICSKYDFVAEGRASFGEHLAGYEAQGGNIEEAVRFVWYVASEQEWVERHG